jgi:glutamate synthase (NADPH/NADH) small chain
MSTGHDKTAAVTPDIELPPNAEPKLSNKERMAIPRQAMPQQSAEERIHNFLEVPLGFSEKTARIEALRCIKCKKPTCIDGCPVGINIPGFITKIAAGDFAGAARVMKEDNILPAICGRVCPQEEQCEKLCTVGKKIAPVAIGRLERFIADWERENDQVQPLVPGTPTGKKVAIVGAGPAGVTAAADLVRMGHKVVVYEALHKPGGVLVYGIPEFRLPKKIVEFEVKQLEKAGVELHNSVVIGQTFTMNELQEKFDAIFVATGAGLPYFMNVPGENFNGVYSANEYLTRLNLMKGFLFPEYHTPVRRHARVAVVGGGNVAMDCARSALRLGAESRIIYRRSRTELPARLEEVENAEEEGVIFDFLTLPVRYVGDDRGWVRGIECLRMELGEPDASGRRKPIPVEGSNTVFEVDAVVCAIGNSPNPLIASTTAGLEVGKHGNIVADPETGRTSKTGVWAGGDVVTGAATVILAMGAGRKAARDMHARLSGA